MRNPTAATPTCTRRARPKTNLCSFDKIRILNWADRYHTISAASKLLIADAKKRKLAILCRRRASEFQADRTPCSRAAGVKRDGEPAARAAIDATPAQL